MTFIEHIIFLRNENKIPKIWNVQVIKPFLENYFSSNTINVYPANCSITSDGKIKGDYVKKGQKPKFYRLGKGSYVLIDEYESPHYKIINKGMKEWGQPLTRDKCGNKAKNGDVHKFIKF